MSNDDVDEWAEAFDREPLTNSAIEAILNDPENSAAADVCDLAEDAQLMRHAFTQLVALVDSAQDLESVQQSGWMNLCRLWAEGRSSDDP